jgi:hypothetical protein
VIPEAGARSMRIAVIREAITVMQRTTLIAKKLL